ncbi:MAG TPA: aminodeoxychorismate synthase component I [Gammaproteobacteria bacterium]|jgi:anthranilate synthase component 1|nr:aminodeoxychorismate synthase component I [Gammaproteobacteria bacterium]
MGAAHIPYDADFLAACQDAPDLFPFLLESAARGGAQGRYDFLFARPDPEMLVLHADGRLTGPHAEEAGGDFLTALDGWWRAERTHGKGAEGSAFRGGFFLYLGYELVGQIEQNLRLTLGRDLPVAFAARTPAALVRDHLAGTVTWVAEPGSEALLEAIILGQGPVRETAALIGGLAEEEPRRYLDQVMCARRYIYEGDIFQANLSRHWSAALAPEATPTGLYARLRRANPAPFAGLALYGDAAIISSSPERLVSVTGRRVDTRPIAGTRPRGPDPTRDAALIRELIENPKERAEHVMLLDMERNDLGRLAEPGSVRVDELMVVESYTHVHHIVSNVCARLREGTTPAQVIRAVFPGGTITGCPKVRCMQIIAELEQASREAYTGAMGWLNLDGDMDLNILIRTLVQKGRRLTFRAGAGIVADSVPERELEETRAKARGLARALGADA